MGTLLYATTCLAAAGLAFARPRAVQATTMTLTLTADEVTASVIQTAVFSDAATPNTISVASGTDREPGWAELLGFGEPGNGRRFCLFLDHGCKVRPTVPARPWDAFLRPGGVLRFPHGFAERRHRAGQQVSEHGAAADLDVGGQRHAGGHVEARRQVA